jgi:hypothetical protein
MPFVQALSYKLIATTVVGTLLLYIHDNYFSDKARQRRQFTVRRRVARSGASAFRQKTKKNHEPASGNFLFRFTIYDLLFTRV